MGITAVQKSMRLNVGFPVSPTIKCQIDIKANGADDNTYTTIFNNNGEAIIGTGIELSGNMLKFTDTFANTYATTLGGSFVLKITNLMTDSGIKVSASGTGATSNPTYVTMKESGTGLNTATMTISGNSALATLQLLFSEYNEYAVAVSPSSGNFTFSDTTNKIAVSDEDYTANVKATTGYNLTISITNDGGTTTLKQNTDYTWDSSTGALKIFSTAIIGNITITCTNNNAITYQIAYNSNDGSGTMSNSSHTYGVSKNLTSCTFTAPTNKKFAGWAETSSGAVKYTDGESVINLATTQDAVVTLYAVWEDAGFTITFTSTDSKTTASGIPSSPITSGGGATITLSSNTSGWSAAMPTIEGNCTSKSFNAKTGVLTLSGISSNIAIKSKANPWIYGTYTNDNTKFPDITSRQNGTVNTGKVWEGYTYIQMANYETQESNYKKSSAGDIPARWIIIGCGDDLTASFFPTSLTNSFADIKTSAGVVQEDGKPNPNPYLRDTSGNKTSTKELASDEILLLSEQTLISDFYAGNSSGDWTSGSTSNLQYDLNNETDTGFFKKSGLYSYISYMTKPTLYTAWKTTETENTHGGATIDTSSYIFLLGSRYGQPGTNGGTPQEKSDTITNNLTRFLAQNFCAEDYLGSYNKGATHNNDRMFAFGGLDPSYLWLRSGHHGANAWVHRVRYDGFVDYFDVYISNFGVRPSFILNLA